MKTWKFAAISGVLGLSVVANATFYTSEASFKAALYSNYYLEDFNNFSFGSPLDGSTNTWAAPGAFGYGWTASTPTDFLWSNDGALSTNQNQVPLSLTFTGLPVTAFGGLVDDTDISGANQGGTVTLTMSNSDTITVNDNTFVGWIGTTAVSGLSLTAQNSTSGGGFDWIQLDHAYTGTNLALTPEPASIAVLGLGALGLIRRRKQK